MTPEYVFAVAAKTPPSKDQLDRIAKHWPEYLPKIKSALTGWDGIEDSFDSIQWANDYAEPGYSSPKTGILLGNWNHVSQRVQDILNRMGYELEWEDEWSSCSGCGKLVRTSPDSYGWQQSFWMPEDSGELFCTECINPSEYLESLHDKTRHCSTLRSIDPSDHGYIRLENGFENGFHPGQNDDPKTIYKRLRESGEKRPLIFVLDGVSQFDIGFSVWAKQDDADTADTEDSIRW